MLPCCSGNGENIVEEFLLNDIVNKPHDIFTMDLIFTLCCKSGIKYMPHSYHIHPNSPFTNDIRCVVIKFYVIHRGNYKAGYRIDAANEWSRKKIYEKFCLSVEHFLSRLVNSDIKADEVLRRVINAAVMSIDFYECGLQDALTFASERISAALKECNKRHDFQIFDLLAKEASSIMESG